MNTTAVQKLLSELNDMEKVMAKVTALLASVNRREFTGTTKDILASLFNFVAWDSVLFGKYVMPRDALRGILQEAVKHFVPLRCALTEQIKAAMEEVMYVETLDNDGA